jgi:hypothetical protein
VAVIEIVPGLNYSGLASDVKPATGISTGAIFEETDTQDAYTYDGHYWQKSKIAHRNYVWNPVALGWEAFVQPGDTGGQGYEVVGLKTVADIRINPAKEDGNLVLLQENDAFKILIDGEYFGFAVPGSAIDSTVWRIKKITDSSVTFADGNKNFDNAWTNRANLNYS